MLFTSQIITKASGSIGGLTASHNRFGQYFRSRVTPVNPNTPRQIVVRGALALLAARWSTLTDVQRLAWGTYALNVPVVNRVGDTVVLTALNMYIRSNVPRIQAALTIVDDASTDFTLPSFSAVGTVATITAGLINVATSFSNADAWANETGGALLVFVGRGVQKTIKFYVNPFRTVPEVKGDDTTPPTSPASELSEQTGAVGNRVFTRYSVVTADGRLSTSQITDTVIT